MTFIGRRLGFELGGGCWSKLRRGKKKGGWRVWSMRNFMRELREEDFV